MFTEVIVKINQEVRFLDHPVHEITSLLIDEGAHPFTVVN